MVDDRSRIWIGRPGARGPLSVIDVFSTDGVLLGRVIPPAGFKLSGTWAGGKFYQISESEDGLPQVTVWRIASKVRGAAENGAELVWGGSLRAVPGAGGLKFAGRVPQSQFRH